jgi:hypothetical protein
MPAPFPPPLQAAAAHLVNLWDKTRLFATAVRVAGCGPWWHVLYILQLRGSSYVARWVGPSSSPTKDGHNHQNVMLDTTTRTSC